jgi:hypothetical protein
MLAVGESTGLGTEWAVRRDTKARAVKPENDSQWDTLRRFRQLDTGTIKRKNAINHCGLRRSVERQKGFEPSTFGLGSRCSTN